MQTFTLRKNDPHCGDVFNNLVLALRGKVKSGVVSVTLSDKKQSRSSQQNRYFHQLVGLVAKEQGECPQRLKKQIKHKLGLIEKDFINGELITQIRSTADLNKEEFSRLIEQVISVCVYLQISYPQPSYFGFDFKIEVNHGK